MGWGQKSYFLTRRSYSRNSEDGSGDLEYKFWGFPQMLLSVKEPLEATDRAETDDVLMMEGKEKTNK